MHKKSAPSCLALGTFAAAVLLAPALLPARALGEPAAPGAARAEPAKVALSLRDVPLRDALRTLFEGSGMQHAVEPAVPNYPITLDIRDVPFNTALRTLLRLAPNVTYRKEGDVYIVGMRQPQVEQPTANEVNPQPEQTPGVPQLQWEKVPLSYTHSSVL